MRAAAVAVPLVVAGLVLTACSGVPTSSSPKVVGKIRVAPQAQQPTQTPPPGADPRLIVQDFIYVNASNDERHSAAGLFLTPDARRKWSPNSVTIIDNLTVRPPTNPSTNEVTVSGQLDGTVDSHGVYTPNPARDSSWSLNIKVVRSGGQWRIAQGPTSLVVSRDSFEAYYRPVSVYFFDSTEEVLVPDLRYSPLEEQSLASWLLDELIGGPPSGSPLQTELPEQTVQRRAGVTLGDDVHVELPGSSQLDAKSRTRLGAQVAATLEQTTLGPPFTITDNGRPVSIPGTGSQFTSADFSEFSGERTVSPTLYFLDGQGNVRSDESGQLIDTKRYQLRSVAVSIRTPGGDTWIAGGAGPDANQSFLMGSARTGLTRVSGVPAGQLTRPTWSPTQPEAWVGDGSKIFAVRADGNQHRVIPVAFEISAAQPISQVLAVRFSPEGARIAIVLRTLNLTQVWLGTVSRTGNGTETTIKVDNLEPVTPPEVAVADVAWNDATTLYVVGVDGTTHEYDVWSVQVDGSLWTPRPLSGLPAQPDSITVTPGRVPWVAAGGTLWLQHSNTWESPSGGGSMVYGRSPAYLE